MGFDLNVLRQRLVSATERADSITSVAQWILFNKRHASEVVSEWSQTVVSEPNKLAQIYVANEVIQQSKIKRKNEYVAEFAKALPSVLLKVNNVSDDSTKDRINRVIKVWRDRQIFDSETQKSIEASMGAVPPLHEDLRELVASYSELMTSTDLVGAKARVLKALHDLESKVNNSPLQDEVYKVQKTAEIPSDDEIQYEEQEEAPKTVDPQLASFLANLSKN